MADPKQQIIVIGAGWAGLACAVKLAQQQHQVMLVEAAPNAGGRARGINANGMMIDNGQHLLMGAYHATQNLLHSIGVDLQQVFVRSPLQLQLFINEAGTAICNRTGIAKGKFVQFKLPQLPKPWNLFAGSLQTKGLTLTDKYSLAKAFFSLSSKNFMLAQDVTIQQALQAMHQSTNVINKFWRPIAKAVMSTALEIASANVFFQVIKDTFYGNKQATDWLLPKLTLSEVLPKPAINFLQHHGAQLSFNNRVLAVQYNHKNEFEIYCSKGQYTADKVVLATPPWVSAELLKTSALISDTTTQIKQHMLNLSANLAQFSFEPITTIYFYLSERVNLPFPILGLLNGPGEWLFDKTLLDDSRDSINNGANLNSGANLSVSSGTNSNIGSILSVVITGKVTLDKKRLITQTFQQINEICPQARAYHYVKVICEKKAAFTCSPDINVLRPSNLTLLPNLYLAGDYTQTGYPATLESAVKSGMSCAEVMH